MTTIICHRCSRSLPAEFRFCGHCGASLRPDETGSPQPTPSATTSARDEFRDVTILFADVSGFTAMSERLDPEALHQLMNDCFDGLGSVIAGHGGHIDKYIGDSIMAVFGAPIAHDDDPERAGDAALAMQSFMRGFSSSLEARMGFGLKLRIGLNSGMVLAGGVGANLRRDYSVMGDTVNTASRLEGAATPGSVLVSGEFRRRVATLFEFGPVRNLVLRGKAQPVEAFELLGARELTATATDRGDTSPFVGRAPIVAELTDYLQRRTGTAGWLEIRGALGVGKTRAVDIAARAVPDARLIRLPSRPAATNRPYGLVRRIIQVLAATAGDTPQPPATFDDFAHAMRQTGDGLDTYLMALWFLAAPDNLALPSPDPDPQSFKRTVDTGLKQLMANAQSRWPQLVLFLDSLEHADTPSRTALQAIYGAGAPAPNVIAASRFEGEPSPHATRRIELARLAPPNAERLLRSLSHDAPIPPAVEQEILARTEGVPLFIEEMIHALVDDGSLTPGIDGAPWTWTARSAEITLPGTLLGTMVARLDRLEANERMVLAQCAVQGPEFDRPVAAAVWRETGGSDTIFAPTLTALERRRLVAEQPDDDRRWSFVQVLLQSAAYNSMLRKTRKELHKTVAQALVNHADPASVGPEILADHYELSEEWSRAARMNRLAGDRAAALFANADALRRYQAAISAADKSRSTGEPCLPCAVAAHRGAALIHLRLGESAPLEANAQAMLRIAEASSDKAEAMRLLAALMIHKGKLQPAQSALEEALFILDEDDAENVGSGGNDTRSHSESRARVLYDLADVEHRLGRRAEAHASLDACRKAADGDDTMTVRAGLLAGRICHTEGRFAEAVAHYRRAEAAARNKGSLSELAQSCNSLGNAARDMGDYDASLGYFDEALEIWSKTGAAESMAGLHNNLANIALSRGDAATAEHHYTLALDAFSKIGHTVGTALARTNLAVLAIERADFREAVDLAGEARSSLLGTGDRILLGLTTVILGEAQVSVGEAAGAAGHFSWVLREYDETSHPLAVAGALRGLGRVADLANDCDEAVRSLDLALALYNKLAREQEAARTQIHLARALAASSRRDEATRMAQAACERFRKIGAERDLSQAEALARTLAG